MESRIISGTTIETDQRPEFYPLGGKPEGHFSSVRGRSSACLQHIVFHINVDKHSYDLSRSKMTFRLVEVRPFLILIVEYTCHEQMVENTNFLVCRSCLKHLLYSRRRTSKAVCSMKPCTVVGNGSDVTFLDRTAHPLQHARFPPEPAATAQPQL